VGMASTVLVPSANMIVLANSHTLDTSQNKHLTQKNMNNSGYNHNRLKPPLQYAQSLQTCDTTINGIVSIQVRVFQSPK
jgi:hypothetical protein